MIWFSFAGTWLLVTGSVFQAVLELREQESLRDDVAHVLADGPAPAPISPWWWLLPPLGYLQERRRWQTRQKAMMDALTDDQRTELLQYINKTIGWSIVGLGGLCLATFETWQVCTSHRWGAWAFIGLLAAATTVCVSWSTVRLRPGS